MLLDIDYHILIIYLSKMDNIVNLNVVNPFDDNDDDDNNNNTRIIKNTIVHIRVFQRKTRKYVTSIEGLAKDLDLKKMTKYMSKEFCCNGTVVRDKYRNKIIQLQGNQRQNACNFLIDENICEKSNIKLHGF